MASLLGSFLPLDTRRKEGRCAHVNETVRSRAMPLEIHFHPTVDLPPDLPRFPVAALTELLLQEGMADEGSVHCVLTDDPELAVLNERFRGKTGPTDVLAFPYDPAAAAGVHGDIYVSLDRAREQRSEERRVGK